MKPNLVWILFLLAISRGLSASYSPKQGDLVFQSLPHNSLVDAIEGVSKSPLSHCGIVVQLDGKWFVLEALGKVIYTPLDRWEARGRKRAFSVSRFNAHNSIDISKFIESAKTYLGKDYDFHYAFDNDDIYCSELPFLAFKAVTGKPLGQVRKLGEMNWKPHEAFIRSVEKGNLPLERTMITPVDLSKAPELETIYNQKD
jgi:hypothetical protein